MWFIFPFLVICILLWMLFTWIDEKEQAEIASPPQMSEPEKKQEAQKRTDFNEKKRGTSIPAKSYVNQKKHNERPHDHTEHHPDIPEALRPRRVLIRRPDEESEEEPESAPENPLSTCPISSQTDAEEIPLKFHTSTQKDVETEESTSQTAISPLRASRGVQADVEREDVGVEALPSVTSRGSQAGVGTQDAEAEEPVPKVASRSSSAQELADDRFESCPLKMKYLSSVPVMMEAQRDEGDWDERSLFPQKDGTLKRGSSYPSESEEESESFESYPLKPKYSSSPSQSEEEESELSSNARRERYSIIQPFMQKEEE